MGQPQFHEFLFQLRLYIFDFCETLLFIALALSLTIHTIRRIIEFGRRGTRRNEE